MHFTVTGDGIEAELITVSDPGREPDHGMLAGTGWHTYPGSRWREDDLMPGLWEVAVFPAPGAGKETVNHSGP